MGQGKIAEIGVAIMKYVIRPINPEQRRALGEGVTRTERIARDVCAHRVRVTDVAHEVVTDADTNQEVIICEVLR